MKTRNTFLSPGGFGYLSGVEEDHDEFTERLRKTLYYGKLPGTDRPSKPLTDMAVEFFQEAAPKQLGKLDNYLAASTARSACMSPCSVVAGMMYVRRLRERQPSYLTQISSSELFLISMMMASKFLYDEGVDEEVFNDEWAESGDMETEDVNELERDFLQAIDWQLFVRPEDFAEMLNKVEKRLALSQALDRGWFSYTDLCLLSQDLKLMDWSHLTSELSKVISVSSLAYLAGILTMVGSTVLSTTASTSLVTFGTTVLPLYVRVPPMLMPTIASLEVERSTSTLVREQSRLDGTNTSRFDEDADSDFIMDTKELYEQMTRDGHASDRTNKQEAGLKQENGMLGSEHHSKETGSVLSGFLPPFIALLALKDTIVKFACALNSPNTNSRTTQPPVTDEDAIVDEICSDGPCLAESWSTCWNVSSGFDWSAYKAKKARACCEDMNPYTRDCTAGQKDPLSTMCCNGQDMSGGSTVRCCCRASTPAGSGSLIGYFPDLFLGFSTSPAVPIFVTT